MTNFDALRYIASNPDLILAFGVNEQAAEQHYLQFGQAEGRQTDSFNELQYLENYPDLQQAFDGSLDETFLDETSFATSHFVEFGFLEGRTDEPLMATTAALDVLI